MKHPPEVTLEDGHTYSVEWVRHRRWYCVRDHTGHWVDKVLPVDAPGLCTARNIAIVAVERRSNEISP